MKKHNRSEGEALGFFWCLFMSVSLACPISLKGSSFMTPKKQPLMSFDSATLVLGEGEDYFLSLFGDSKKLVAHSSQTEDVIKHLSVILEEVGQFTSRYTFE